MAGNRPHLFVDETKARGLLVAAAVMAQSHLNTARQVINHLVLPRQRSIHFCKEKDERRRRILDAIRGLSVTVVIYDAARYSYPKDARDACLAALVTEAAKMDAERLVLELDDSALRADRKLLNRQVRIAGVADRLRYDHLRSHEECLLSIPDAVAWSWAKGGEWRTAIRPVVTDVREV